MPTRLKPIGHADRLSVVEHLSELRSRLVVCAAVLIVAFGFCFWQNSHLLHLLNAPLRDISPAAHNHLSQVTGNQAGERRHLLALGSDLRLLSRQPNVPTTNSAIIVAAASQATQAAQALPRSTPGDAPLTIGVGEPFTVTITVCFYFALLVSLPVLLYEAFAFTIPALNPRQKEAATPLMIIAPALFFAGAVFTYVLVLPSAIRFLQGYNSGQFQAFVQAKTLYSFEVMTMGATGLAFEMPIVLLGLRAAGIIDASTLTRHWRYAAVILAVIAATMPGADPVTTGLEIAPLAILFVASVVALKIADRRAARQTVKQVAAPAISDLS